MRNPLRPPKSSTGRTSGRPSWKISSISTVQRPIPRTAISRSMIASSSSFRTMAPVRSEVVNRQNVRPPQLEDQQHFDRPTADSTDRNKPLNDRLVVELPNDGACQI